jgi:hypothetical protein
MSATLFGGRSAEYTILIPHLLVRRDGLLISLNLPVLDTVASGHGHPDQFDRPAFSASIIPEYQTRESIPLFKFKFKLREGQGPLCQYSGISERAGGWYVTNSR